MIERIRACDNLDFVHQGQFRPAGRRHGNTLAQPGPSPEECRVRPAPSPRLLVVTVIAALVGNKGKAQNAVAAAPRHAIAYLDVETDPAVRENIFTRLLAEKAQITTLPEKYRARIRDQEQLMALLTRAHAEHESAQSGQQR